MIEVLLLGRPIVRVDGQTLKLRDRNKGLALLVYLASNGPTTRDRLADLLWSDLGQTEARRNLRQRLYELKNQIPEGCLVSDGETLHLQSPISTDLERFETHLNTGDDEAAVSLWHDTPFTDLELSGAERFQEWLDATRERLEAAHHGALRRVAASREASGDLRGALEAHRKLLSTDELQEFHQREVMRLLEALGEREAALLTFERYRDTLKRELETAPLPATQQLAERMRRHLGAAETSASSDAANRPALDLHAPLTGRDEAWRQLERHPSGLSLIVGEPGIGKTRLAEELTRHLAAGADATWRAIRGREGSSASPLYPVAEALRQALEANPIWVEALEPVWRSECARLVPEIDPSSAPQPMPSLEGRVRFLEGLARALTLSVGAGGAILLDDLHWFDPITLELVAHLARRSGDARLRLVATARGEELSTNEAAAPILLDLKRDALLHRLELEPLAERDVRALIQALSGGLDAPNFAHRLHDATDGNPFYLLETLRELHGGGALQVMANGTWVTPFDSLTSSYSELPIAATVRETVLQRVSRAGPAARRLLEAASLAGDGFTYAVVGGAVALSEWEGIEALERAVNAQLIEASSQISGAYVFNHDLTRRALDDALNPDRRRLIHQKLAVTLETLDGSSVQIAEHFERGGWNQRAAKWRVKAGEEAARVYAYEQALEHYEKAIDDKPDAALLLTALQKIAHLYRTIDDRKNWQIAVEKFREFAFQVGDSEAQLRAEVELSEVSLLGGHFREALIISEGVLSNLKAPNNIKIEAQFMACQALINLEEVELAEKRLISSLSIIRYAESHMFGRYHVFLAEVNIILKKSDLAKKYKDIAENHYRDKEDEIGILRTKMVAAEIFDYENKYTESIEMLQSALEIADLKGLKRFQQSIHLRVGRAYRLISENEKALEYLYKSLEVDPCSPRFIKDINREIEEVKKSMQIGGFNENYYI